MELNTNSIFDKKNWFRNFLILVGIMIIVNWLLFPVYKDVVQEELYESGLNLDTSLQLKIFGISFIFQIILLPIILFVKFSILGGIVCVIVLIYGYEIEFKKVFSAFVITEYIYLIPLLIILVANQFFDTDLFQSINQINHYLGLGQLVDRSSNRMLYYLLGTINIFEIAYFICLGGIFSGILKINKDSNFTSLGTIYLFRAAIIVISVSLNIISDSV